MKNESTHRVSLEFTAVDTDTLQQLFDLTKESDVEDWTSKVNVSKVTRTLRHSFATSLTLVIPINRAEPRIRQASHLILPCCIVFHLRELNFANRECTL